MSSDLVPNLYMLLASCLWTYGYIYCNENNVDPTEFILLRGIMIVLVSYVVCRYNQREMDFRKVPPRIIILRNAIETFHGFYTAFCQFYLPLNIVHTVSSVGIIFVLVFDYFIDHKKITKQQSAYIGISFLGILTIINWGAIEEIITGVKPEMQTHFQHYKTDNPFVMALVAIGLVIVMALWAYSVKLSEQMKLSGEQVNLTLGFSLTLAASIGYFFIDDPASPAVIYPGFLFSGLIVALSQFFFILGILKSHHVGITMSMGNSCIVFAYILSVFRYSEPVSIACLIGTILTVIGVTKVII